MKTAQASGQNILEKTAAEYQNLNNLNYLNLNNTSIDKNEIKRTLLSMLPTTEIEYGHEKMLNRKLMWTINGSRNCVCSF